MTTTNTPPNVRVGVAVFILQSPSTSSSSSGEPNPTLLFGKRKGSHGANTYALPGGHLEHGETPEGCAIREVAEETGLEVKNVRFLTVTNDIMKEEKKHYVTLFMVCEREDEEAEPETLEPNKCEGWEWVSWEEFLKIVKENEKGEGEKKLFLPMLNLVRQWPGVVPSLE